ncbi:pyridoxamine 5'-phosphate oxidase family protein [Glycomyces luteolus]|uniref:Pyridoxamine 5'-phosphate oxidase family protein n=1 Tax=Glycomyces luteolus TaxID=2670330 RepID=A0A9X3PCI8_9ACTN|nr:pyridoxamine 5'-phosphate oxidase family protein [Glycomyces luteolus]MDA1360998.1 pyridoxamine 5'-phosphate oxidase family protein [Glycomyces luteolus]
MDSERKPVELDPKVAMGLLIHAEFGRVAFVADGLPTIRPLNHAVFEGRILVHTGHASVFAEAVRAQPGLEVAYQVDEIKPHSRLGWSVLVAGTAVDVTGERGAEQLGKRVQSWINRPLDTVIAIKPRTVTGLRLTIGD